MGFCFIVASKIFERVLHSDVARAPHVYKRIAVYNQNIDFKSACGWKAEGENGLFY